MNEIKTLKTALESAYANLENHRLLINSLNVFPVPDGDTGDNMCMTFNSGLDRINQEEYKTEKELIADFALACLMGARGNSGVILSLAVKGFSAAVESEKSPSAYLVKGFQNAVELCYSSVSSPKEGTALTVLRACADKAAKTAVTTSDIKKIFSSAYVTATATLSKTKELLPELKEANVVDAGAKGLVCLMEGIRLVLEENKAYEIEKTKVESEHIDSKETHIKNRYCCECVIKGDKAIAPQELERFGDSIITAATDGIIKLHVHSNSPDAVLKLALERGEIIDVKIENMRIQHNSAVWGAHKAYGFVSVSSGDGITQCFKQLGCDEVITSHRKIASGKALEAISKINSETVYLLPNDKNNFLAFKQAMKMTDKNCIMLETEDVAQGIGAMMNFDGELTESENTENMLSALSELRIAKVCVADKALKDIKKGNSIGIIDGEIKIHAKDNFICLEKTVEKLCDEDYNDISVFYGESVKKETAEKAENILTEKFPKAQISFIDGGQNIYDYIVMVN